MNGKARQPMSIHDALMIAIGVLPDEIFKPVTGHSKEYLYQCSDPDDHGKNIWFGSAARLEAELIHRGKHAVFTEAFGAEVTRRLDELTGEPSHDAMHPTERTCDTVQTAVELLSAVRIASHPDSPGGHLYTPNEAQEIRGLVLTVMELGTAILKDVDAHGTEGHLKAVS